MLLRKCVRGIAEPQTLYARLFGALSFGLKVVYPGIGTALLATMVCGALDDTKELRLEVQYQTRCSLSSEPWVRMLIMSSLGVLFWIIGIPLLLWRMIQKDRRSQQHDYNTRRSETSHQISMLLTGGAYLRFVNISLTVRRYS